ncbi:hypothetical protein Tco_1245244 [Tanacetum coccineum]
MAAFWVVNNQLHKFISLQFTLDYDSQMTDKYFVEYTGIEVKHFGETLLQHMSNVKKCVAERTRHQRQHDRRVNKRQMQTQVSKIDTGKAVDDDLFVRESSGIESEVQDDNSRSVNDTEADDADIRPIYDEEPMAEVDHESMNSSKNMPRFSSNDMAHNHYLDEARKKTQEKDRNSKASVMPSARFQSTADGSKPKPRSNNQTPRSLPVSKSSYVTITAVPKADHSKSSSSFSDSKHFVCSTCHKYVFNANHDACITKLLKQVNSHAKIQSHKTIKSNKHVDQKSHTQKPDSIADVLVLVIREVSRLPPVQYQLTRTVKGWLDEDLDNYHLKRLRYSTQCHTQMSMWIISRGVVLLILLMEYKICALTRKLLEYMDVHVNDASRIRNHHGGGIIMQVRRTVADFSHRTHDTGISPSPDDKKQWSLVWYGLLQNSDCALNDK